ncbi:alpha/beta hydrolase [Mycolicibacter senuensis]|uniref:Putative esterase n=1 Tax=Mycolicibacter senuensis TaxID=386913 RepID=A0A7I9XGD8_9MYCO|nr:alpha/beta hydrolase [Mycolicibacter senuensis]MDQ2629257.1 alpha/beta hydrolase [Actinomycetota bacterium]ORW65477.1 hypothetical protein AWC24_17815 [Mycolicibacter senuensis]GFG69033.1 putative esterase [Mycolicibacter senuensis]
MASLRSHLITMSLRAMRSRRFYADAAVMRARLPKHQDPRKTRPIHAVRRRVRVRETHVGQTRCYVLEPQSGPGSRRVLHLHGGGFVEEPEPHHWRFLRWLVEHVDATVVFPIYPLCPSAGHRQIRDCVHAVYDRFLTDVDGPRYVSGDSAGGALTLDLVGALRDQRERLPTGLGLISPWLDMALADPRSAQISPHDPELGIAGLRQAGRWYADGEDVDDPGISPVHADFTGFPPMAVFTGTRDILNPDARRVRDAATARGVPVDFHEYDAMFHNWLMQPIPEGSRARAQLGRFVQRVAEVV